MSSLPPEDNKLVVLARATRARTGAAEGAALRDLDGRTYAGATVDLPSLQVSAVGVVIAMAVASGAKGAEAAVVLSRSAARVLVTVTDFLGTDYVTMLEVAGTPLPALQTIVVAKGKASGSALS